MSGVVEALCDVAIDGQRWTWLSPSPAAPDSICPGFSGCVIPDHFTWSLTASSIHVAPAERRTRASAGYVVRDRRQRSTASELETGSLCSLRLFVMPAQ